MKNYLPLTEGASYELTPTLSALAPFRDRCLVLSGFECIPTPGRPGGAHAKASTRFLTNVSPPTSETWLDAGISVDQILARETGKHTQLASLELAIESAETAGACDTGFACPYTNTISWKSQNTPLPTQNNPRVVFERLFGDSTSTDPGRTDGSASSATQRARLGPGGGGAPSRRAAADRSDEAHRVSRCDSRRRAAHPDRRAAERSGAAARRSSCRHSRPAGKIISNLMFDLQVLAFRIRPDARHHADGGARAQRHDLIRRLACRTRIIRFRTTSRSRTRWRRSPRSTPITCRCSRDCWPSCRTRRRRRHAARPHDRDVRRRDGRQQQPLADRHPDDPGGRRRRTPERRPAYPIQEHCRWPISTSRCWISSA